LDETWTCENSLKEGGIWSDQLEERQTETAKLYPQGGKGFFYRRKRGEPEKIRRGRKDQLELLPNRSSEEEKEGMIF